MNILIAMLIWPVCLGGAIEATKIAFKQLPVEYRAKAGNWLPLLVFAYGAISGALLAPDLTFLTVRLLLSVAPDAAVVVLDNGPFRGVWAFGGIGAAGVAGVTYEAVRSLAPDAVGRALDWWK